MRPKPFSSPVVTIFMIIDNSLRKRWGSVPNQQGSLTEEDPIMETDHVSSVASGLEIRHRFRVSAQEWLNTWRTLD